MKREITLNNISVGAYMRHFNDDGTGEYIEFNDVAKSIFGCEDVPNSPYWRQELEDINDRNVLKSDIPFVIDYPIVGNDGRVFKWLAFTKNKVVSKEYGTYIVTTIVDETQRKLNEELIEEQNGFLEAMYKYLPVGVARMDLNGRVLFANEKIVAILGLSNQGDILGKVIFDDPNFPPEIKERLLSLQNDVSFTEEYDFNLISKKRNYKTANNGKVILKHRYSIIYSNEHLATGFLGITEDITDSIRKEEALDMTRQNLSIVLENGRMSTWNYDVQTQMFNVLNGIDTTKNQVSYDEHFNTLVSPEYIESSRFAFDNVVMGLKEKGGSVYKTTDPMTGKSVYRKTSYIGIKKDGVVTNVIGTSHDVTDIYAQQEELLKSQKELNLALEAGDISAWTYDVDKQKFYTLYGKAVAGKGLTLNEAYEQLHPDDRDKMKDFLDSVIEGRSSHEIAVFRFKFDDVQGGYRYLDSRIVGKLENGRVTVITGTQKDVTEEYLINMALNKAKEDATLSNQLLNVILARIPGALFIKDASDNFKYYIANDMYCNTISKNVADVIGKTDYELYDKKTADNFRLYDISLLDGSATTTAYESVIPAKEKNIYWQISKSIIKADDGRLLILGVATDVSALRGANIELKEAKQKAEESDNLKSTFLANMSHEIRTPLNAIVGFSDLLIETEDPQEKGEYCKIITTNSEMLLRLIGDILDLSKIESGNTDFKRQLVDISQYFDEITSSLKQRVDNPDVEFIIDNPYSSCYINIDKERLGQIITNYVTNAIKYTPSGHIKVGYVVENKGVKFYVEDTGVGIPDDKKWRVFNRFDKLDSFAQGTGLGLSIVKALSEYGGGKCGFDSVEGKGSTFWTWKPFPDIRFSPAEENTPKIESTSVKAAKAPDIKNILIAEDNESNYILTRSILKGYHLIWATNGADAVAKAAQNEFDVILMDLKMPIMDGLEATREIRKFNPDIPIIAVTANAFPTDRENAMLAGCSAFLPKPIKKAELLAAIAICK